MERLDAALIDLPGVQVRVLERCTSTNTVLLEDRSTATVLLAAEEQTSGRGRRGRRWHSAAGADVTFSLARRVRRPVREFGALSLVAGVAAASALRSLGVAGAALKWPNDLMVEGAKLGGILVETRGDRAVLGIGINCSQAEGLETRLRRRVTSLDQFIRPDRNAVIRNIAGALLHALERFDREGFEALRCEWETMDAHAGQRVRVRLPDGRTISGIAGGLAVDGALRLHTRRGERAVHSGRLIPAGAP